MRQRAWSPVIEARRSRPIGPHATARRARSHRSAPSGQCQRHWRMPAQNRAEWATSSAAHVAQTHSPTRSHAREMMMQSDSSPSHSSHASSRPALFPTTPAASLAMGSMTCSVFVLHVRLCEDLYPMTAHGTLESRTGGIARAHVVESAARHSSLTMVHKESASSRLP